MLAKLIDFYRYTLGQDLAGIIESAVAYERKRIIKLIDAETVADCCWQYHSGHVAKSNLIDLIEGETK
jgi:hypothetical protein